MEPAQKLLHNSYILSLAPEEQREAFAELGEQLFVRVMLRVMAGLPEADRARLSALMEAGADEQVSKFLADHAPNLEKIMEEEAASLAEDRAALLSDPAVSTRE